MKKIYIIVAVVVVVIGAAIWLISSNRQKTYTSDSKIDFNDKGFSISQGGKTISGENLSNTSDLNLGIAVYPSSEIISGQNAAQNLNYAGVKAQAATYQTTDAKSKVEKYYETQIGSDAVKVEAVNGSTTYTVIKSKTNIGPIVTIYREGDTTFFTIVKTIK